MRARTCIPLLRLRTVRGTRDTVHKHLPNERPIFKVKGDPAGRLRSLFLPTSEQPSVISICLGLCERVSWLRYSQAVGLSQCASFLFRANFQHAERPCPKNHFLVEHLRVSCRHNASSPPHILVCVPTNEDIIPHNRNIAINVKSLTLTYDRHLLHAPHSDFSSCSNNVTYSRRIQPRMPHGIEFSCLPRPLPAGILPPSFLDFRDGFDSWELYG